MKVNKIFSFFAISLVLFNVSLAENNSDTNKDLFIVNPEYPNVAFFYPEGVCFTDGINASKYKCDDDGGHKYIYPTPECELDDGEETIYEKVCDKGEHCKCLSELPEGYIITLTNSDTCDDVVYLKVLVNKLSCSHIESDDVSIKLVPYEEEKVMILIYDGDKCDDENVELVADIELDECKSLFDEGTYIKVQKVKDEDETSSSYDKLQSFIVLTLGAILLNLI